MPARRLTDEQRAEVARRYTAGETVVQLAAALNVSTTPIDRALKLHGVSTRDPRGVALRHACDHAYFDTLDEARAYWVGFLFADGCVSESKNGTAAPILALGLAKADGDHVIRFREALGSTHKIQHGKAGPNRRTESVRVSIPSWALRRALAAYGVVPRKSMVAIPPVLPGNLARHFWRGVFDGNGTISAREKCSPMLSVCGSPATCLGFAEWASAIVGRPIGAMPIPQNSIWVSRVSGYQGVARLCNDMYRDASVWLERKRAIVREIVAHAERRAAAQQRALLTLNGVTRTTAEWAAITGLSCSAIYQRRAGGHSDEAVLTAPPGARLG